jgi:7-keto-8-aminopelargonate synthetase-like enzyme
LNDLEDRIIDLEPEHRHVWYLADGIYSMSGEPSPAGGLRAVLDRHPQLHAYVDDAHGMSWTGTHGCGSVLERERIHPRLVVVLSLAKAFAASGAAMVFPNADWAHLVRTCGSTMIFSGPLQPALLGAAIASAKVHLSDEIVIRQAALLERIELFNACCRMRGVKLASPSTTPIRFVRIGAEESAYVRAAHLMHGGFFANVATYPAVPKGQAGIRVAITVHQRLEDIRELVERLVIPC